MSDRLPREVRYPIRAMMDVGKCHMSQSNSNDDASADSTSWNGSNKADEALPPLPGRRRGVASHRRIFEHRENPGHRRAVIHSATELAVAGTPSQQHERSGLLTLPPDRGWDAKGAPGASAGAVLAKSSARLRTSTSRTADRFDSISANKEISTLCDRLFCLGGEWKVLLCHCAVIRPIATWRWRELARIVFVQNPKIDPGLTLCPTNFIRINSIPVSPCAASPSCF